MCNLDGQITWQDLGISFSRMCLDSSVPTKEQTSKQHSPKLSASQSRILPVCLCLKGSGRNQGASTPRWETGALLGDFMTASFGEQPSMLMAECSLQEPLNGVSVSRLSQILTDSPPQKYSLSAKACQGILNRAQKRGKELPAELKQALTAQSQFMTRQPDTEAEEQAVTMTEGETD